MNSTGKIIKHKTGLPNLAGKPGNVSKACQVMGYSRDTFYRYKPAFRMMPGPSPWRAAAPATRGQKLLDPRRFHAAIPNPAAR